MSAGLDHLTFAERKPPNLAAVPQVVSTLATYPTHFRVALETGLLRAKDAGIDPVVYESWRSAELQELYWHRGRDVIPPVVPVTNARSNMASWHGFGLAVDIISIRYRWFAPPPRALPEQVRAYAQEQERFFRVLAREMKALGLSWGGQWRHPDLPHFQWGRLPASPSEADRTLRTTGGVEAVWAHYGAA